MRRKYKRPRPEAKPATKVVIKGRDSDQAKLRPPKEDPKGKTKVAVRLDNDVLKWFRRKLHEDKGSSLDSLINSVLREHVDGQ